MTDKVLFRGYTLDPRTAEMVRYAERLAGFQFKITQGSYNAGGVSASAGTHDGGGAVDFSVRFITPAKRGKILRALKDTGFAAWYRPARVKLWTAHIHAVAIGCADLAPVAARQVTAYDAHRDGLAGNAPDPTYRPTPPVRYNSNLKRPTPRKVA